MKQKPRVCVIDEDERVRQGWELSLKQDADLFYYRDHLELFKKSASDSELISSFQCIIISRYFSHLKLDIVNSPIPDTLKVAGSGPIFLNWQGYIKKDELVEKFDGKLFHKFGVRWQTLRLRVIKTGKRPGKPRLPVAFPTDKTKPTGEFSKPQRCTTLLRSMASNATGEHKSKIAYFASEQPEQGMKLLEAIYSSLMTSKDRPATCPSRYINSSPVVAKRILREALFGD